jgi:hypothetical protein
VVYSDNESNTSDSDSDEEDKKGRKAEKAAAKPKEEPASKPVKKRKKTLKDEFKMDIRDMIVKKRIASLNASAIMSASADFRWRSPPSKPEPSSSGLKAIEYIPTVTSTPAAAKPKAGAGKDKGKTGKEVVKKKAEVEEKKEKETKEENHIIVEIEDERIKSQLIASAMKKTAGKSGGRSGSKSKRDRGGDSSSENNTVVVMRGANFANVADGSSKKKKFQHKMSDAVPVKKRRVESTKTIVVDGSSSSDETEYSSDEVPTLLKLRFFRHSSQNKLERLNF